MSTPRSAVSVADYRMASQVVWVTGASRGLGSELVGTLVDLGARVAITSRSGDDLDELVEKEGWDPQQVLCVPGSVAVSEDVDRCTELILHTFKTIDVLVNNAGISPSYVKAERLAETDWRSTIDVNLTGAFLCAQAAGRVMISRGSGSIVNVSSMYGQVGGQRLAAYAASKGGLDALTRTLALEWAAEGVRVNSVAPGYLRTDLTRRLLEDDRTASDLVGKIPLGRFGAPPDVIPAVLYLASAMSGYTTGTVMVVDGGWTAQ